MNREVHVRICEGRRVRFPPATRPASGNGVVVSDAEKAQARRQVWVEKANASKPLMRRRKD